MLIETISHALLHFAKILIKVKNFSKINFVQFGATHLRSGTWTLQMFARLCVTFPFAYSQCFERWKMVGTNFSRSETFRRKCKSLRFMQTCRLHELAIVVLGLHLRFACLHLRLHVCICLCMSARNPMFTGVSTAMQTKRK